MLEPGAVLDDRYRLDDRVATGGMGEVWRATDRLLGRTVAVKALLPALMNDPAFVARFDSEARIMAALRHPGIVDVYDYGPGYLVMEWVDGETLAARLLRSPLSVAETLSIVGQTAWALQAAHDGDVVHRDVKPGNLLMTDDGTVRLVDFGVAWSADASTALTATNAVPGTARYMAPEQALGERVTAAADIYALGAVAYHCLAGHPPFEGETPVEVALHHVRDEPAPLPADVPPHVRDLVGRAMAKDPAQRFASAAAMADAAAREPDPLDDTLTELTAIAAVPLAGTGSPVSQAWLPEGEPARSRREIGRRTKLAAAGAGLALALLAIFVLADLTDSPAGNAPGPVVTTAITPSSEEVRPTPSRASPRPAKTTGAPSPTSPPPSPARTSGAPTPTPSARPTQ